MLDDAAYLAIIVGLFVAAFLLVIACDRIIGPDEVALAEQGGTPTPQADETSQTMEEAA